MISIFLQEECLLDSPDKKKRPIHRIIESYSQSLFIYIYYLLKNETQSLQVKGKTAIPSITKWRPSCRPYYSCLPNTAHVKPCFQRVINSSQRIWKINESEKSSFGARTGIGEFLSSFKTPALHCSLISRHPPGSRSLTAFLETHGPMAETSQCPTYTLKYRSIFKFRLVV